MYIYSLSKWELVRQISIHKFQFECYALDRMFNHNGKKVKMKKKMGGQNWNEISSIYLISYICFLFPLISVFVLITDDTNKNENE